MWRSIKDDNTLFCVVCCKCARVSCTRDVTEISWQSAQESNSLHRMNSFQYVVVVISLCYASYTGIIEDLSTVAVACERVIDDDCISYTVVSCLVSVHHHWRRLSHSVLTSQCTDQPSLSSMRHLCSSHLIILIFLVLQWLLNLGGQNWQVLGVNVVSGGLAVQYW